MAEGSSVDLTTIEKSANEPDGLNLTSEILREDEAKEKSWDSFLEDSIHERAAKILRLGSVKELFTKHSKNQDNLARNQSKSRTESLVNVMISSMATDMRKVACSVSPSPKRLSRTSHGSNSVASTSGSISTQSSHLLWKSNKHQPEHDSNEELSDEMQHICNLQLPNDDSLLSEPELDQAFSNSRQTIDILSAAGNLQERRRIHGGYGTPSSYASEQEMKLYFDNTPNPDPNTEAFLNENIDKTSKNNVESSLYTISLLDDKMKDEIISVQTQAAEHQQSIITAEHASGDNCFKFRGNSNDNDNNKFSSALLQCTKTVEKLEDLVHLTQLNANETESYHANKPYQAQAVEALSISKSSNLPFRRNSDGTNVTLNVEQNRFPIPKLDSKTRLSRMLKRASESLIDDDISKAVVINLTTPDLSQICFNSVELAPFESFQESLKEFKSIDDDCSTTKSCDDYISEDYSPRSDESREQSDDQLKYSVTPVKSFPHGNTEYFVNESLAQTYQSPLLHDFEPSPESESSEFSSANAKDTFFASLEENEIPTSSDKSFSNSSGMNEKDLSLDLSGFDDSESLASDQNLTPNLMKECENAIEASCHTPIFCFEGEYDQMEEICTARNLPDVCASNVIESAEKSSINYDLSKSSVKSSVKVEDRSGSNNNVIQLSCLREQNADYYLPAKLEKSIVLEQCISSTLEDVSSKTQEDVFQKTNVDQANVAQLADLLDKDGLSISNENRKEKLCPKLPSTSKEEIIHTFANALADEMMQNTHLHRKDIELLSCSDSGAESGYCTTAESRSKKLNEEQISEHCPHQAITHSETESRFKVCFSTLQQQPNLEKPLKVPKHTVSKFANTTDSSEVTHSCQTENGDKIQQFEAIHSHSVFEAKVSALTSRIKSYEEYEPPTKFSSQLIAGSDSRSHNDLLIEVAKNEVEKIINECLLSLQKDFESNFPTPNQDSDDVISDDFAVIKRTSLASTISSVDSKHNALVDDGPPKEFKECPLSAGFVYSESTPNYQLDISGLDQEKKLSEKVLTNKSILPKILITCPSVDIGEDLISDMSSKENFKESKLSRTSDFFPDNCQAVSGEKKNPTFSKHQNAIYSNDQDKNSDADIGIADTTNSNNFQYFSNQDELTVDCIDNFELQEEKNAKHENYRNDSDIANNFEICAVPVPSRSSRDHEAYQNVSVSSNVPSQKEFALNLKCKYKDLDEQIDRILNPTPSPPPSSSLKAEQSNEFTFSNTDLPPPYLKQMTFDSNVTPSQSCDSSKNAPLVSHPTPHSPHPQSKSRSLPREDLFGSYAISSKFSTASRTLKDFSSQHNCKKTYIPMSEDFQSISETLQFIKKNLNRNDESVRKLEDNIRESWVRILALDEDGDSIIQESNKMSPTQRGNEDGPTKVRALEEVVGLLKKHIQQRESEINGLGTRLRQSNEKIKELEQKLNDKNLGVREDRNTLNKELRIFQKERDILEKRINERIIEKEDAKVATRKANMDLQKEKQNLHSRSAFHTPEKSNHLRAKELRERVDDLEFLNRSSEFEKPELNFGSLKRENKSLRAQNGHTLLDLKMDNSIMREKLDRMNEISTENLLLQSDAADFHAELADLRTEAKHLRTKCYELTEDNRQCKAEIRDLRRYIELLKANKTGDSRQDLLSKIEYYQMEHDRLMDEIRRLKQRLGEVSPRSPRSPRQRSPSPMTNGYSSYPGPSLHSRSSPHSQHTVTFSKSLERGRSPVSDAIAASTASSLAAARLAKERSLSPSAALNIRDLTMDRYNQHMNGRESPHSIDSDSTEFLLKPHSSADQPVHSGVTSGFIPPPHAGDSDDEDIDFPSQHKSVAKLTGSFSSHRGGLRSSSRDRPGCSPCKRSCSPTSTGGFRSVSPRMTSTQNQIPDTARDRYPTKIKKSLPRRAFAPRSPADLKLGYCIKFTRPGGRLSRGTVKYIGHLPTRNEIFIGVELDGHDGKHSGTFQGTKYFTCPSNKGIFTPFSKIIMAWE